MRYIRVSAIIGFLAVFLLGGCGKPQDSGGGAKDSTLAAGAKVERKVLYWYDPMNPTVRFDRPGKSPFMDMDLLPKYADGQGTNANVISVDPAMVQNIGVLYAPVERRKLTKTIHTVGVVSADEKSINDINTRVSGWIEQLYFDYTGMGVKRGQPMAVLYSPELIAAEQEFLQAVTFASAGGTAVSNSDALIKSARDRLVFFGMSNAQIDRLKASGTLIDRVVIHSPGDGVILEKDVFAGQKISAGQTLFRVADLTRVWILADVFRIDMPFLKIGSQATIVSDNAAARKGNVDFIFPEVDPTARSVKARIPLVNPRMDLKIGQYVEVAIHSPLSVSALAVPSEAVINTGLRKVVAVALGGGRFEMRTVELGPYADGYYAVLSGLHQGEEVVTSGQFLIDSDANLKSAGASLMSNMPEMAPDTTSGQMN